MPARCSLSMDGTVKDPRILLDVERLERFVRDVARAIGMRVVNVNSSHIQEDLIGADPPRFADEGGYSIVALITTSHIALHTWPEQAAFMFDVVSCRSFDLEVLRPSVITHLNVKDIAYEYATSLGHPAARHRAVG